jgi:peptidoglycan/LPS O-acetylase OafA/YrhL
MDMIDGRTAVAQSPNGSGTAEFPLTDMSGGTVPARANGSGKQASIPHIRQLTGIRALAAVWVLLFHFRPELLAAFPFLWPLIPVFNVGYLGVDLFFILSGFILTFTHLDRMTTRWGPRKVVGFLWLRLSRIWPLLFFMLLVWGVYNAFLTIHNRDPRMFAALRPERFLDHALLIHAWTTEHHDWNPVDWSLSAEWLAYLVFGVLVVVLAKFRQFLSTRAMIAMALISVLPIVLVGLGFQDGSDLLWHQNDIVAGIVPLRVLCEFAAGAMVALLVLRHGAEGRVPALLRPSVLFVVIIAGVYLIQAFDPYVNNRFGPWEFNGHTMWGSIETVLLVPVFLLLIGALAVSGRDPFSRALASRFLVWGGKVSFALYLCHWLFLDAVRRVIQNLGIADGSAPWLYRGMVVGAIAAAVLSAHLLFRFVEEPCRRAMRKMLPKSMNV